MRIRHITYVSAIALLAILVFASSVLASTGVVHVSSSLNVRSGPGTGYAVVDSLANGTSVQVTGQSGSWYKVITPRGITGYVYGSYLSVSSSTPSPSPSPTPTTSTSSIGTVTVTTSILNVRSGPSTGYSIVGRVYSGNVLTALAKSGDWYKVKYGSSTAYVHGAYVRFSAYSTPTRSTTPTSSIGTVKVTTSILNVRSGPSTGYSIVGRVYAGNVLTALAKTGDWYKVQYGSGTAYVHGGYVSFTPAPAPAPTPTPTPTPTAPSTPQGHPMEVSEDSAWGFTWVSSPITSTYATTTTALNVRTGPSTSYSILTTFPAGTKVLVQAVVNGVGGDWVKFNYNGRSAYMAKWYTTISQQVTSGTPISGVNKVTVVKKSNGDFALTVKSSAALNGTLDKSVAGTVKLTLDGTNLASAARTLNSYGFGKLSVSGSTVQLAYSGWTEISDIVKPDANSIEVVFHPALNKVSVENSGDRAVVTLETSGFVTYSHSYANKVISLNTSVTLDKSPDIAMPNSTNVTSPDTVNVTTTDTVNVTTSDTINVTTPDTINFIADVTKLPPGNIKITLATGAFYRVTQSGNQIKVTVASPELKGKTIVLDPGHGGNDPGAIGYYGTYEKVVNLNVALKLRDLLVAQGANVVMTRTTDTAVLPGAATLADELQARVDFSARSNADLFLSIHHNSSSSSSASGTSVWWSSSNSSPVQSNQLATLLQNSLVAKLGYGNFGVYDSRFYVTRNNQIPAALAEIGFLSNPTEEKLIASDLYQTKAAEGLAGGLAGFFASYK